MAKHIIGTVDEIPPGERKLVTIEGREIGVFNVHGEFYALRNRCPHQGGALCKGRVSGFVTANVPGEYEYTRKGEILRCPWHGWEYDIKTGQSWVDPSSVRVRSYEVEVAQGAEIEGEGDMAGLVKGPYVAETFEVTVEETYLVVEI
ncbi:MAG: Rieske (2Fe-2S) protein [Gemmatimonadota bacterium]|nr:Rieske (2Fe-2S) protein [Gemmatimonadota bacterium]